MGGKWGVAKPGRSSTPAKPPNTGQASDEPSSGAPEAKAASAPSSVAYGGIAPASTGTEGTRIWTGHGVLAHNLVKISALPA